jgi:hypothetical protein
VVEVDTPQGTARATVHRPPRAVGTVVLGHGAGGQGWSGDLVAVTEALVADGWAVVLVDQPWRVAGKKVATPPPTLDAAWVPVVEALLSGRGALPKPLVVGGRSAGARVACRTAERVGADAVLCLSFPLHPPGRPESSRAEELLTPIRAGLPVRVVQGERDPFGTPDEVRAAVRARVPDAASVSSAHVSSAPGTHSFGKAPAGVVEAVRGFVGALRH